MKKIDASPIPYQESPSTPKFISTFTFQLPLPFCVLRSLGHRSGAQPCRHVEAQAARKDLSLFRS